jgi:hypothetical protein
MEEAALVNGWDVFTWAMALVLVTGSVVVFAFFLRDLGAIFRRLGRRR